MDQEKINSLLREGNSDLESKVVREVNNYMKVSASFMSKYWPTWERNEMIYRGYRVADKEDLEAADKGEPTKLIIPITYAQTQTYLSFFLALMFQRERFFELVGRGPEDQRLKEGLELDLQYQMERNQHYLKLYLWALNSCNYGFGVLRAEWKEEHATVRSYMMEQPAPAGPLAGILNMFGMGQTQGAPALVETTRKLLEYQGTRLSVVSPYNFYPDPDFPLASFQDGAYLCTEEEKSKRWVTDQEQYDVFHGTDKIPQEIDRTLWADREHYVGRDWGDKADAKSLLGVKAADKVLLTECVMHINPKEWREKFDLDFGPESTHIKYIATIANGQKLVRLEPYGYLHDKYNCAVMEYSPSSNEFVGNGLASTIHSLQETMTWFLNSHIQNVRKAIHNQFVVNPDRVELQDILKNSKYIRTKGAGAQDFSRLIQQLSVTDVTASHVGDVEILNKITQAVTGIGDNAQGQYATGRRSAYESRQVNAGISGRLKMHGNLAFQAIEQLGQIIVANTRQGRSQEIYNMIVGELADQYPFEQVILTPPEQVIGGFDFAPLDTTLPSERQARANLFMEMLGSPEVIAASGKDPSKLVDHIFELMGVRNIKDFNLDQQPMMQPQVVPDEMALQAAQAGAQPTDPMGDGLLAQLAQ